MTKRSTENASWLRPLPEEFANEGMSSKTRMILASITFIVLVGFGVLLWFSYTSESDDIGTVPVVRADNSVVKVKPVEPGGKEVLFQDREVFEKVDNLEKEDQDVLASSSEIPLKRPVAVEPVIEEMPENVPVKIVEEVEAPVIAVKKPTIAPAPKGLFMVQIAAIADKGKAEAYWKAVLDKNLNILINLKPTYMEVDLGAKGVLYRVRAGMLGTRDEADDICDALKDNNQSCLVVSN